MTDFKKILKYQISDRKSSFVPLLNDNNDLSLLFYTILFNYSLIYFVPVAGKCWNIKLIDFSLLLPTVRIMKQGYIFWPARKILPCFCGFFAAFKLHKGILTCVLSLFSFFSSFPPFSFPFFKYSFKFFPAFQFGQDWIYVPVFAWSL